MFVSSSCKKILIPKNSFCKTVCTCMVTQIKLVVVVVVVVVFVKRERKGNAPTRYIFAEA